MVIFSYNYMYNYVYVAIRSSVNCLNKRSCGLRPRNVLHFLVIINNHMYKYVCICTCAFIMINLDQFKITLMFNDH